MTSPRRRIRALFGCALATALLSGCGGDGGSDAGAGSASDSSSQTAEDASGTPECVGDQSGSITLKTGSDTKLPEGGNAALGSTDFDAKPPTATLELRDATKIEEKNATGLAVGDQFGIQRGVYVMTRICTDQVQLRLF